MSDEKPEPVGSFDSDGRWKKTDRIWIPEINAEARIRVERLKQDLDLEKHAAADGSLNQPGHDDKTLNEIQMQICNRVFAGILLLNQFLDEQVSLAIKNARALLPAKIDSAHLSDLIVSSIDKVFHEHRRELVAFRSTDLQRHRDLRLFRHNNSLTRSADYKDSSVLVAGVILTIFLIESILNGTLLAQVVSTGLLGGIFLAGAISAINIASGLVAGFVGWRNIGHKRPAFRVLGVVVAILCHALAIAWNFFVGHFREVSEKLVSSESFNFDPAQLTAATVNHIHLHGFFGVESLQSWALLILGIFIHFLAAKEGWDDVADRYPGYKHLDVRANNAHEDFENGLTVLRDAGRTALERVEKDFENSIGSANRAYQLMAELLDVAIQRQQEVRDSEDEWVTGGNQLLRAYREINSKIRDPDTTPPYFATYPNARDYRNRNFGSGLPTSDDVENRSRSVEALIKELARLRDDAKGTFEEAQSELKNVRREVNSAIKGLDKRIDDEALKITSDLEKERRKHEAEFAKADKVSVPPVVKPADETA
jgi:F0F1-type ATP synthase membrane subunit b/b'